MADFNPDEYLAKKTQSKFDPDAYLATKGQSAQPKQKQSLGNKAINAISHYIYDKANTGAGAIRGAGSIGATLLAPLDMAKDAINGKGLSLESNRARRADMDGDLRELGFNTNSSSYAGGKLAGEIALTAGVGNVLGLGAKALGLTKLGNSIASGGFSLGDTGGNAMANALMRVGGGAINGGASAGLVDPDSAGMGATIGGAIPIAGKALGESGKFVASAFKSKASKLADRLVELSGMPAADVKSLINQQGPQIVNAQKTVPQLMQNQAISQMARTAKTIGAPDLVDAEALQNVARMDALRRVGNIDNNIQDTAQNTGNAIRRYALGEEDAASSAVSKLYENPALVSSQNKLNLPISEMEKSQAKYLGDGTFGTGKSAQQAIDEAKRIGIENINYGNGNVPATSLLSTIKQMGGINLSHLKDITGEARTGAGIKGIPPATFTNNGQGIDDLATQLQAKGFNIPYDEVDGGVQSLRDMIADEVNGVKHYSFEDQQRLFDASMAPTGKESIAKQVPFKTLQNLRSSLGESIQKAMAKGDNKEAAAMTSMIKDLDNHMESVAIGKGASGENFPMEALEAYGTANAAHSAKMDRFHTGPQYSIFRNGGDGLPSVQGAEIPPKFFNSGGSQVQDMESYRKLVNNDPAMLAEMKNYAATKLANSGDRFGVLTNAKFDKTLQGGSGGLKALFSPSEMATINGVGDDVNIADMADELGRVKGGSDTAQKIASLLSNGLLDNKAVDVIANKTPVISSFTGPVLNALRKSSSIDKAKLLSEMLSNPGLFSKSISKAGMQSKNKLLATELLKQSATKALPVAASQ